MWWIFFCKSIKNLSNLNSMSNKSNENEKNDDNFVIPKNNDEYNILESENDFLNTEIVEGKEQKDI